jgi:hypothetical protein
MHEAETDVLAYMTFRLRTAAGVVRCRHTRT